MNRALERYRSQVALRSEVAKMTIAKMTEVWSSAYEWEVAVNTLVTRTAEVKDEAKGDKEVFLASLEDKILPLEKESNRKAESAGIKIGESRFWITSKQYEDFRVYQNTMTHFIKVAITGDQQSIDDARRKVDEARPSAGRIAREFF